jgi:8-oxo-dGTP pyrophosphatase MutT (NUDIX family)
MQVRSDGTFGFAGGYVEAFDSSIVAGLNRELVEELNVDLSRHHVTQNDHICSHVCSEKTIVSHFYGLEVTVSDFYEIEGRALTARDWGVEVSCRLYIQECAHARNIVNSKG